MNARLMSKDVGTSAVEVAVCKQCAKMSEIVDRIRGSCFYITFENVDTIRDAEISLIAVEDWLDFSR